MTGDRMKGHRERVGDSHLIGHALGYGMQHAVMGGHQLGVAAGDVGRNAGMDACLDVAVGEAPAQAVVPGFACGTGRFDTPRPARQPRVEHHPLTDIEPACLRSERNDVRHHFVPHHLRE